MLPKPLVRRLVVSDSGIPHKIPIKIAHTNRETPGLTLNTIKDIKRIAIVITKANKTFIHVPITFLRRVLAAFGCQSYDIFSYVAFLPN